MIAKLPIQMIGNSIFKDNKSYELIIRITKLDYEQN